MRLLLCIALALALWGPTHASISLGEGYVTTPLEDMRVTGLYRKRMTAGLELFDMWFKLEAEYPPQWWLNIDLANHILANFVNDCYKGGELKIWIVRHALVGLQTRHKNLRFKIVRPWDAMRAWQMALPLRSRQAIE